jgi:hypothetical protein
MLVHMITFAANLARMSRATAVCLGLVATTAALEVVTRLAIAKSALTYSAQALPGSQYQSMRGSRRRSSL